MAAAHRPARLTGTSHGPTSADLIYTTRKSLTNRAEKQGDQSTEKWWAVWRNNPDTLKRWRTLRRMASKLHLHRPDLIPDYAWYVAYGEESFHSDQAYNLDDRCSKVAGFRPLKDSSYQMWRKTRPAYRELSKLLVFMEKPTTVHAEFRKQLAAEIRQLTRKFENLDDVHRRNKAGVLDSFQDPSYGQRGVARGHRKILISIAKRALCWWETEILDYKGKSADMLALGGCWRVMESESIDKRALKKVVHDAVASLETSNLLPAHPPPY